MKKYFLPLVTVLFATVAIAQKEKFDIASFVPPKGWQRMDSNHIILFMDSKTVNGQSKFCQLFLYPSKPTTGNAKSDFDFEWNYKVVQLTGTKEKPTVETGNSDGWEVTTGYANINHSGIVFTCMLVTATGFGREMSVLVNVVGQEYMQDVQNFLNEFDLDSEAATALNNQKGEIRKPQNITNGKVSLNDYQFQPPARWYSQKNNNAIFLSAYQADYGCSLTIYPPQPSTGNLETDARNIYNQFYGRWQYRYSGEKKEDVSKGYTLQGLEYCMIEAPMQMPRPDGYYFDYENGQVLVINVGGQIAVIVGRHQRGEMTCFCKNQYDYWNQFFNSFTVNNVSSQQSNEDAAKRIVGSWQIINSVVAKYIFASNGHYQFIGAYSTSSLISPTMIEVRTSGFKGDGSYTLNGNKLTTVRESDRKTETQQFRFEKVNHGGTGWKERIYLLTQAEGGGLPNEVCYEKEN